MSAKKSLPYRFQFSYIFSSFFLKPIVTAGLTPAITHDVLYTRKFSIYSLFC